MGAWSHEPFGNDDAGDWAAQVEGARDLAPVERAFDQALAAKYLEAPDGAVAVAAVEVIAKLLGRGTQSDSYTELVDAWVRGLGVKPGPALLDKARRALARVRGEESELRDLWEEAGAEEWNESLRRLEQALSG